MKTNTPHSRLHPNYGKVRLYTLRHYRYVKPFAKQIIQSLRIIILIGVTVLVGYLIGLAYRQDECVELEPVVEVEAIVPTPTPEYLPSKNTRNLINANPGFSGKLKEMYGSEWRYAAELIARESSFNPGIFNPTSGACGLGQFLPCSKLKCELTDIDCQLRAIDDYVAGRYKTFKGAVAFHDLKKQECLDKQARGEISQNKVCAGWY